MLTTFSGTVGGQLRQVLLYLYCIDCLVGGNDRLLLITAPRVEPSLASWLMQQSESLLC
jgi:hypothetical protein